MGLMDIFRPKWKHSDSNVRMAAVETLTDQVVLAEIARTDENRKVCEAAFGKLTDQSILAGIARIGWEEDYVRVAAIQKLADQALLAEIAKTDEKWVVREAAVRKMTDQSILAGIARKFLEEDHVRVAAVERLTDQTLLAEIVQKESRKDVCLAAVKRLTDQALLAEIAKTNEKWDVRMAAKNKVTDQTLLAGIAREVTINETFIRIRKSVTWPSFATGFATQRTIGEPDLQFILCFKNVQMAAALLGGRPENADSFLIEQPSLLEFSDGTAAAKFKLRPGQDIHALFKALNKSKLGDVKLESIGGLTAATPIDQTKLIIGMLGAKEGLRIGDVTTW